MHLYGLIGYPLTHSFSRDYFTSKFKALGLSDHVYQNFPLRRIEEFPGLLVTEENLRGLNVTIPYKETIIPYLHVVAQEARDIGAVNTICFESIGLVGYNTDWLGFRDSLIQLLDRFERKPSALILGSGGSAKAVAFALAALGIAFTVVSRYKKAAVISYDELPGELVAQSHLIINTTPLGMNHLSDMLPGIDYDALTSQHLLYDLIYNPEVTPFLKKGLEKGAAIKNGLEMLYRQADAGWTLWQNVGGRTLQG
jgi:shikimate dehydrogenase